MPASFFSPFVSSKSYFIASNPDEGRTMRVLVYGFGPYRDFPGNITETIIKSLPAQPNVKTVVFPVRFDKRQFIDALKRHRPDTVIGLGQCTRNRPEIEFRAINRKRASKMGPVKSIRQAGAEFLSTTLDIKLGRQVGRSNNAGDYVCNYSMYVMLDYISRTAAEVKFTFLHIPHDSDPRKGTALVTRAIKKLQLKAIKHP
jgi:pyrrolidone-carboxylate peptidase